MDLTSIKRLGLDQMNIDIEKSVEIFDSSTNNHTIIIYLLKQEVYQCPHCSSINSSIKGTKRTTVKSSTALEDNIKLQFHRRQIKCNECFRYFQEYNPFTTLKKHVSIQKEIRILEALRDKSVTFKSLGQRFDVSPTYISNLFDKKVDLPRLPLPEVMCVDEVYNKKISYNSYCFIIYSPQQKKVVDVLPSRRLNDLITYFSKITIKEKNNVKYFSMDMYDNYRIIAKKCFPQALICADSFHVIKNIATYFHQVRIRIMKKYSYLKEQNDNYYWLFKDHWRLLTRERTKLSRKKYELGRSRQYMSQREIVSYMLDIDNDLKTAYELFHEYRNFNEKATEKNAKAWLEEMIDKFLTSGISEYIPVYRLLTNWKQEILNSFSRINGYRVSNGPMERANRDIKTIFRNSFGSKNFPRTRNRIMYCMNENSSILYTEKNKTNKAKGRKRGSYKRK